uniref:Uncharacterized protein n=1 Tax=Rhizoctonia solani TaxID=456999 RepID=N0A743_9AGAM|nr:hypothetical protein RSOL_m01470 [Rhizoctonia solani]AGK45457.1 hypothetical protein RSOL_m01470 [Rhizoctonia solani]
MSYRGSLHTAALNHQWWRDFNCNKSTETFNVCLKRRTYCLRTRRGLPEPLPFFDSSWSDQTNSSRRTIKPELDSSGWIVLGVRGHGSFPLNRLRTGRIVLRTVQNF